MTRNSKVSRRQRLQAKPRHTYLPHFSWARAACSQPAGAIAPEDFWARLGL